MQEQSREPYYDPPIGEPASRTNHSGVHEAFISRRRIMRSVSCGKPLTIAVLLIGGKSRIPGLSTRAGRALRGRPDLTISMLQA